MEKQLDVIIDQKIRELHETDATCLILLKAIELCSNKSHIYVRDLIIDTFFGSHEMCDDFLQKDFLQELTNSISCIDNEFELENPHDLKEINDWIIIEYRRFLFYFLSYALKGIDKLNETINEDYS